MQLQYKCYFVYLLKFISNYLKIKNFKFIKNLDLFLQNEKVLGDMCKNELIELTRNDFKKICLKMV